MNVHILRSGWTLCGLGWLSAAPEGDRWVSYLDSTAPTVATCAACLAQTHDRRKGAAEQPELVAGAPRQGLEPSYHEEEP